jgi:maltose alpha-D-glucosyltransferase/alpha-amylase
MAAGYVRDVAVTVGYSSSGHGPSKTPPRPAGPAAGDRLRVTRRGLRCVQWPDSGNAGFSDACADDLVRPVIDDGDFLYERVNVAAQHRCPESLLAWFDRMLHTLQDCEEIGVGRHTVIPVDAPTVMAHRAEAASGSVWSSTTSVPDPPESAYQSQPDEADQDYDNLDLRNLELDGHGYRWIRLRRTHARW